MIWAQDQLTAERITSIPANGGVNADGTPMVVEIYASFTFSGVPFDEQQKGIVVKFIVGSGGAPQSDEQDVIPDLTEQDVLNTISPIDGVSLVDQDPDTKIFDGVVEELVVRGDDQGLQKQFVARAILKPISFTSADKVTVAAYCQYDKLGAVLTRLQASYLDLTVVKSIDANATTMLSVSEKYNPGTGPGTDSWATFASMLTARTGHCLVPIGGKLYAIGGLATEITGVNEEYDPVGDTWQAVTDMPTPRAFAQYAVVGGKAYVIGGYDNSFNHVSTAVEIYDPTVGTGGTWTQGRDIGTSAVVSVSTPIAIGTSQAVGTDIYVMFGATEFDPKTSGDQGGVTLYNYGVHKYDTVADSWSLMDVIVAGAPSGTTSTDAPVGATFVTLAGAPPLGPYGVITFNRGLANQETIRYVKYDGKSGQATLAYPLQQHHLVGSAFNAASLNQVRIFPVSYADTVLGEMHVFDGQQVLGYSPSNSYSISRTEVKFNVSTGVFTNPTGVVPNKPRHKAGYATDTVTGKTFVIGGSSAQSDFLDHVEVLQGGTFTGPSGLKKMSYVRASPSIAFLSPYVYVTGGSGNGHEPGWLQLSCVAAPTSVRADGRQTASVVISATDSSGDAAPSGVTVRLSGVVYLSESSSPPTPQVNAAGAAVPTARPVPQRISILPVLFSAQEVTLVDGTASATVLARSEDVINEVDQLGSFVAQGESIGNQQDLKNQAAQDEAEKTVTVGVTRSLYSAAIEATVVDDFYNGQTNTDATISSQPTRALANSSFSMVPPPSQGGLSASLEYYSDITSIPDVQIVSTEVAADEAKDVLEGLSEEIPFGSSPFYDAMQQGAMARNIPPPPFPISNIMIAASDNEQSYSSNSPSDVVEQANSVAGPRRFPIFVTNFIVTSPVSISARRSRTDVADLEYISFNTGGNSFSVVDQSYEEFVLKRIKTSAPSSLGSGSITVTHVMSGYLSSVRYMVGNLAIPGNSATMELWYSDDAYNWTSLGVQIPPNATFSVGDPIKTKYVKYKVTLSSETYDSPMLMQTILFYVEPNVQYLFTFPQAVAGQVSELAAVVNHRLPEGGTAEVGISHGESLDFDRDYATVSQPAAAERGIVTAVNRSYDTVIDEQPTEDVLKTDDYVVYASKDGPWSQDAITRIFVDGLEAGPADFIARPEEGVVAFRKKLLPSNVVTMEVQNPPSFRLGIRLTNPSVQEGVLDSYAYMFGGTEQATGKKANRPPRAVNPFVSPSPAVAGGTLTANYTYADPDGNPEDTSKTLIMWYRNGTPVVELNNKTSVSRTDILAKRNDKAPPMSKGEQWSFSVRPSDGSSYGPLALSPVVVIANSPPSASNVMLRSSNKTPSLFTTSDTITIDYTFTDMDSKDKASGTRYTFYANGVAVKTGTADALAPDEKDANGRKILIPGVSIRGEVVPSDGSGFGLAASSDTITILGSAPSASNVTVVPTSPSAMDSLTLDYAFNSPDGNADVSSIAWFDNNARVSEMDSLKTVPNTMLTPGHSWYAIVTPNDGTEGTPAKSNSVVVQF
jgi:hypothetical protein